MSTATLDSAVKQAPPALLEIVRQELVPTLEQIVRELPEALTEFAPAEKHLRSRFLELARIALERWAQVAERTLPGPTAHTAHAKQGKRAKPTADHDGAGRLSSSALAL